MMFGVHTLRSDENFLCADGKLSDITNPCSPHGDERTQAWNIAKRASCQSRASWICIEPTAGHPLKSPSNCTKHSLHPIH